MQKMFTLEEFNQLLVATKKQALGAKEKEFFII